MVERMIFVFVMNAFLLVWVVLFESTVEDTLRFDGRKFQFLKFPVTGNVAHLRCDQQSRKWQRMDRPIG